MNALTRCAVATTLAVGIVVPSMSAAGAQGVETSRKAPCTPSIFHFSRTTYSGLTVVDRERIRFGNPSMATYNPNRQPLTVQVNLSRSETKSMSVSASVEVEASALVASVRAQTGVEASRSVTITSAVEVPVRIPPKQFGWVQAEVGRVTVTGTVTTTDLICNKVTYRGPITTKLPVSRPYLVPVVGVRAP